MKNKYKGMEIETFDSPLDLDEKYHHDITVRDALDYQAKINNTDRITLLIEWFGIFGLIIIILRFILVP